MSKGIRNIIKLLNAADTVDIDEGRVAYFRYKEVMLSLSQFYGYSFPEVVAVFAALSPNTDYYNNLRSCATVLDAHRRGIPQELVKVSTYNHRKPYAFSYLNGVDFLTTVTGKKIYNFYLNISNPLDPYPVTIDGHALNIWRNKQVNLQGAGIKPKQYEELADGYREVARRVSLLPHQIQAITWFAWKRRHNLVATKEQLSFFQDRSKDIWKTLYSPEDLKPYDLLS